MSSSNFFVPQSGEQFGVMPMNALRMRLVLHISILSSIILSALLMTFLFYSLIAQKIPSTRRYFQTTISGMMKVTWTSTTTLTATFYWSSLGVRLLLDLHDWDMRITHTINNSTERTLQLQGRQNSTHLCMIGKVIPM